MRTGGPPELAEQAAQLYEEEEREMEKEKPHLTYRKVLSKTALAVADRIGWNLTEPTASFLAEELPSWTPFPDTNPALEILAKKHRLGILSNVDNDLIAGTLKHLKSKFDYLITAENVGSYKPAFPHFEEARRIINGKSWAHVAASQYHDISPAIALGIPAFWVNRKGLRPDHQYSQTEVTVVDGLSDLVSTLCS